MKPVSLEMLMLTRLLCQHVRHILNVCKVKFTMVQTTNTYTKYKHRGKAIKQVRRPTSHITFIYTAQHQNLPRSASRCLTHCPSPVSSDKLHRKTNTGQTRPLEWTNMQWVSWRQGEMQL